MERPRQPRPLRAIINTLVVLLMGAAIGYSVYPLTHSVPAPSGNGDARTHAGTASMPPPLEGVEPLDAVIWPGRHLFVGVQGTELDTPARQVLAHVKPGAVVLRGANFRDRAQVTVLIADIKAATGLGTGPTSLPLIAIDLRDADLQTLGLEAAPVIGTLASIGNADTARTLGRKFARELSALGFSLALSPMLDVFDPAAFAEDAAAYDQVHFGATEMALAFLAGAKEGGIIPIALGFPGRQSANAIPDSPVPALNQDRYELAKIMYSFIEAVSGSERIPAILIEHVAVPTLDDKFPTRSAALSPVMVGTVLRKSCEYDGVIVGGDITEDPAVAAEPTERVAVQSLAAGCDAVMLLNPDSKALLAVCKSIEIAVFLDTLSGAQLDASKARLDTLQNWLRAIEHPVDGETVAAAPPAPSGESPEEAPVTPPTVAISREEAPVEAPVADAPPVEPTESPDVDAPPVDPTDASNGAAATEDAPAPEAVAPSEPEAPARPTEHTVAEHESLTEIANQYGVTVKNLLTWNSLLDPQVQPGQVLRVAPPEEIAPEPEESVEVSPDATAAPVDEAAATTEEAPGETAAEPATTEGTSVTPTADTTAASPDAPAPADDASLTTHTVAAGDTLYRIAMKYNTTAERIIELNNIKNSNVVVLGSKLKVPKP